VHGINSILRERESETVINSNTEEE